MLIQFSGRINLSTFASIPSTILNDPSSALPPAPVIPHSTNGAIITIAQKIALSITNICGYPLSFAVSRRTEYTPQLAIEATAMKSPAGCRLSSATPSRLTIATPHIATALPTTNAGVNERSFLTIFREPPSLSAQKT